MSNATELRARQQQLLDELAQIENELAAQVLAQRKAVIEEVRAKILDAGLTREDIFPSGGAKKVSRAGKSKGLVPAKYRNASTGESWSGRGKQPRWLAAALAEGRQLSEFAL